MASAAIDALQKRLNRLVRLIQLSGHDTGAVHRELIEIEKEIDALPPSSVISVKVELEGIKSSYRS